MRIRRLLPLLALAAALAVLGGTALGGNRLQKITSDGVGKVKLGKKHSKLRAQGLVSRKREGCPLGGPGTRAAKLRRPLRGSVNYTSKNPRRVRDITITSGATARGVGIGDKIKDIKAAYSKVKVNHSTDDTFELTLVTIPKRAGGEIVFAVDTTTKRIKFIGVPYVAFCE